VNTTPAEEASLRFREAMACFPTGVTIVTTTDQQGRWYGFTATSFCSVSVQPPLVLVCLAKDACCHRAFLTAQSWVVQVIPARRVDLATLFASRGADKFAGDDFTPNPSGHPVLADSCVVLECHTFASYDGGDHTILVGRVMGLRINGDVPAVYFQRGFHVLPA
jgi:flavin reductase ActVB